MGEAVLDSGTVVGQLVVQLPVVLVLVVGLILVAVRGRRLSGRARSLGFAGIGLLLLGALMSAAWSIAIPSIVLDNHLTSREYGPLSAGVGTLLGIWHAAGLALLIGAVVSLSPRPGTSAAVGNPTVAAHPDAGHPAARYQPSGPRQPGPDDQR
jgi:hypothetical protein